MTAEQRLVEEGVALIRRVVEEDDLPFREPREMNDVDELVSRSVEDSVCGSVQMEISDDRMMATASFFPPQGFGRALDLADVHGAVAEAGIVAGINDEVLSASLFVCNTERTALHQVEFAFGEAPVDAVPAHLRLVDRPAQQSADDVASGPSDRIDYRDRSTLSVVTAGEVLAVMVPAVEGRDGFAVTGETLPHGARSGTEISPGENTVVEDGELLAAVSGLLHLEDGVVSVTPTLVLSSGVDYRTGNITFDGDVVIGGQISDGFRVACAGTLLATCALDAYQITCGALACTQGVIGHGSSLVTVERDVRARFIQNARILAGGSVSVTQSLFKAHVTSNDWVRVGDRGTIVATTVRAGLGLDAYDIGGPGAASSEIYLGIDFGVDERLATIRDQIVALNEKLREVRLAVRHNGASGSLVSLESELEATIAALSQEAARLVVNLDRDEEAQLIVRGTIHAGTYLEICHRSYFVEKTARKIVFRLDKNHGAVVAEPLDNTLAHTQELKR